MEDKLMLRKISLVETVNDQPKNIGQIEHSRHRSPVNFARRIGCLLLPAQKTFNHPAGRIPNPLKH